MTERLYRTLLTATLAAGFGLLMLCALQWHRIISLSDDLLAAQERYERCVTSVARASHALDDVARSWAGWNETYGHVLVPGHIMETDDDE